MDPEQTTTVESTPPVSIPQRDPFLPPSPPAPPVSAPTPPLPTAKAPEKPVPPTDRQKVDAVLTKKFGNTMEKFHLVNEIMAALAK